MTYSYIETQYNWLLHYEQNTVFVSHYLIGLFMPFIMTKWIVYDQ